MTSLQVSGGLGPPQSKILATPMETDSLGSNLGPVKSDTVLPAARHRCDISLKEAVLPGRKDAEMGPRQLVTRFGVLQRV